MVISYRWGTEEIITFCLSCIFSRDYHVVSFHYTTRNDDAKLYYIYHREYKKILNRLLLRATESDGDVFGFFRRGSPYPEDDRISREFCLEAITEG